MDKGEWQAAQIEVAAALRLDPDNARAKELQREIALHLQAEAPPKPEAEEEQAAAQMFSTQPVTLRFRDTDIKEVLEVFARTAGVNIFTDESLPAKRITTFFKDLPLREAFNLILVSNRLFAKRVAPNTVIVVPDNPGKRQQYDNLTVQTFYLSDADARVAVNLLRTILTVVKIDGHIPALARREPGGCGANAESTHRWGKGRRMETALRRQDHPGLAHLQEAVLPSQRLGRRGRLAPLPGQRRRRHYLRC
jgi:general secretion pathway protein D